MAFACLAVEARLVNLVCNWWAQSAELDTGRHVQCDAVLGRLVGSFVCTRHAGTEVNNVCKGRRASAAGPLDACMPLPTHAAFDIKRHKEVTHNCCNSRTWCCHSRNGGRAAKGPGVSAASPLTLLQLSCHPQEKQGLPRAYRYDLRQTRLQWHKPLSAVPATHMLWSRWRTSLRMQAACASAKRLCALQAAARRATVPLKRCQHAHAISQACSRYLRLRHLGHRPSLSCPLTVRIISAVVQDPNKQNDRAYHPQISHKSRLM